MLRYEVTIRPQKPILSRDGETWAKVKHVVRAHSEAEAMQRVIRSHPGGKLVEASALRHG
jgi:hypothetical protein